MTPPELDKLFDDCLQAEAKKPEPDVVWQLALVVTDKMRADYEQRKNSR